MSDAASWYARKFGGSAPQQNRSTPPTSGYDLYRQRHPEQFGEPPVPPPGSPTAGVPQPEGGVVVGQDGVSRIDAGTAMRSWRGREGARETATTGNCPACGSTRFFSRSQGIMRGPAPAPECWDCGYPLIQSGSGEGALAGSSSDGAHRAAQVKSLHTDYKSRYPKGIPVIAKVQ